MAILHIEGFRFELGAASPNMAYTPAGGASFVRRAGRKAGTYGVTATNPTNNGTVSFSNMRVFNSTSTGVQTLSVGFSVQATKAFTLSTLTTGTTGTNNDIITFTNGAAVVVNAAGSTKAWTVLVSQPLDLSVWHWVSLIGRWNDGTTGWAQLYIDGILYAERTSGDAMSNVGYQYGFVINLGNEVVNVNNSSALVCDLVFRSDATLNQPIPESRVDVLVPTSDVASQWTPSSGTSHYPLVADTATEPLVDVTSYVSATAAALDDTFRFQPLPVDPLSIQAVQVRAYVSAAGAGSGNVATLMNDSAGTATDPFATPVIQTVHEKNSGADWTRSTVNSVVAGVRSF